MPERASYNDQSHDKTHDDSLKLLIALRRALGAHAKTPTLVQAGSIKNSHH